MGTRARIVALALVTALAGGAALLVGPDGWGDGMNHEWLMLRLPRVLAALGAGAALGMAGAGQQGVFRNPLADPGLTGVFGGALLGAALLLSLAPEAAWEEAWRLPAATAAGSLGATALLLALGRGRGTGGLLLAGLGINALAGAATLLVTSWADGARATVAMATAGNWLGFVGLELVALPLLVVIAAGVLLMTQARGLDTLALGESSAWAAGADPRALAWRSALLASVAAGAAVCLAGQVAFVGLLAPHLARRLVGAAHARVLPAAALTGALIVLLADTAGRCGWLGRPLPAAGLVALLGAPAFLWLARRHA
jgi:iron complex transport system permease protein